jgi:tripartite-type tricarboxylate transporter receptor subunit TctC
MTVFSDTNKEETMKDRKSKIAAVTLALAGSISVLAAFNTAAADNVADFYKGKNVTLIVASGAGGAHSAYSRLLLPHLQKNMPGNPTFIIQNMPGAGGTKAANYLYNSAARDGSYVGILLADTPLTARLRTTGVKYKPGEFQYLGAAEDVHHGLVVRKRAGIATLEEAMKKQVILGSSGKGSQTFIVPTLMNAFIGTKFKVVTGYPGLGGIFLAIDKGEADGFHATIASVQVLRPGWVKQGVVRVLAVTALDRSPVYPDAPKLIDFVKKPIDRAAIELVSGNGTIGRAWLTTPGVPADRLAALRTAFDKSLSDPETASQAKARNMNWGPLKWQVLQQQVDRIAKADPKVIAHMRKALGAK